ncbi:DUF6221 family protein [Streptomyces sp. YIM S03343]
MSDLVEFLRACLDEDERIARAATPGPWGWTPETDVWDQNGPTLIRQGHDGCEGRDLVEVLAGWGHDAWGLNVGDADKAYFAAHDPVRVLRETDARRRIIAEHALNGWVCSTCDDGEVPPQAFPCPTLRLLALPYADKPGYREEWAP